MLYSFEIMMLGALLLTAMAVCGAVVLRRRRAEAAAERARASDHGADDLGI